MEKALNGGGSGGGRGSGSSKTSTGVDHKKAIVKKDASNSSHSAAKRFRSFGFVKFIKFAYDEDEDDADVIASGGRGNAPAVTKQRRSQSPDEGEQEEDSLDWYSVRIHKLKPENELYIRIKESQINLSDLAGFNNTGNVCVWPSEEVMAYFCAKNSSLFENKSVCELGGGMTCLAGLAICAYGSPSEMFLTDGNEASFKNLETICSRNEFDCVVECCLLRWEKDMFYDDLERRFDFIICADCLFFDESREALCHTIYKLLKSDGLCFIFAPNRKNTFHKFVDYAKAYFECVIVNNYDDEVWMRHMKEKEQNDHYDHDVDYPLLLQMKKLKTNKSDYCKMVF